MIDVYIEVVYIATSRDISNDDNIKEETVNM